MLVSLLSPEAPTLLRFWDSCLLSNFDSLKGLKKKKKHEFKLVQLFFPARIRVTLLPFLQPGLEVQNSIWQVLKGTLNIYLFWWTR